MAKATEARDQALARVEENADPEFLKVAIHAIRVLAENQVQLTADAVWFLLDGRDDGPWSIRVDGRALGAVLKNAAALGWISASDKFVPSIRRKRSPIRVWISMVFQP